MDWLLRGDTCESGSTSNHYTFVAPSLLWT